MNPPRTNSSAVPKPNLYESDFYQWTQETAQAIAQRDFSSVDWENLIEEIEALGRAEKRAVKSFATQLMIHLLLYQYWTWRREYYEDGWEDEVDEFRDQLKDDLKSKRLYNYFVSELDKCYESAKRRTAKKYRKEGLDVPSFPESCPYTVEQLLDLEFFPNLSE